MTEEHAAIEPTEFDLIVAGTGLQEALLAGAAAQAGKSVLHLDAAGSYGAHWASHRLDALLEWAQAQQGGAADAGAHGSPAGGMAGDGVPVAAPGDAAQRGDAATEVLVPPSRAAIYSHISVRREAGAELGPAREYSIDLAPKAAYCAGPLVKALLASGAHNYLEFKALAATYMWRAGRLVVVPATRADIFAADGLSLPQRRGLTRFLTAAQAAMHGEGPLKDAFDARPFAQLLAEQGLAPEVRALLLYAVAMLSGQQEPPEAVSAAAYSVTAASGTSAAAFSNGAGMPLAAAEAADAAHQRPGEADSNAAAAANAATAPSTATRSSGLATAAEGLLALRLYVESAGKYGPGTSAFLLPYYGAGELPQAFCRVAAVAGALYVLRRSVTALLLDESGGGADSAQSTRSVRGVRVAGGQELRCSAFAGDVDAFAGLWRVGDGSGSGNGNGKALEAERAAVARAIAVTDESLVPQLYAGGVPAVRPAPAATGLLLATVPQKPADFWSTGAGWRWDGGGAPATQPTQGRSCYCLCWRFLARHLQAPSPATTLQGGGAALVVFPPRSLPSGNAAAVRVLQVGAGTAAAPAGRFLLYATTAAGSVAGRAAGSQQRPPPGLADVEAALAALAQLPPHVSASEADEAAALPNRIPESSTRGSSEPPRAQLLVSFVQSTAAPHQAALPGNAACSAPPDGSLDFRLALDSAAAAFARLCPEASVARAGMLFGAVPDSEGTAAREEGEEEEGSAAAVGASAGDEDSDDDALAALEAALAGIGGGPGS